MHHRVRRQYGHVRVDDLDDEDRWVDRIVHQFDAPLCEYCETHAVIVVDEQMIFHVRVAWLGFVDGHGRDQCLLGRQVAVFLCLTVGSEGNQGTDPEDTDGSEQVLHVRILLV